MRISAWKTAIGATTLAGISGYGLVRTAEAKSSVDNPEIADKNPIQLYPRSYQLFWARPSKWEKIILVAILYYAHTTLSRIYLGWKYKSILLFPGIVYMAMLMKNIDDARDYENWLKCETFRERGLPKSVWPYKVRYDWTKYEDLRSKIDLQYQKEYEEQYEKYSKLVSMMNAEARKRI